MNNLGWIDFSRRDRDLARNIIASLNEPGAVDELGIGVIRDAFADYFFPGTSTLQTIVKYFFLISYQLEDLTRTPHAHPEQELRKIEHECSRAMWNALSPEEQKKGGAGIFGRTFFERKSRDWVKRAPSTIYWGGIRKLGLWKCSNNALSLAEFLRLSQNQESVPVESDENWNNVRKSTVGFEKIWHWDLPPAEERGHWRYAPSVKLTAGEARFFLEQIQKELPDSLFAFLLAFRHKLPPEFSDLGRLNLPGHLQKAWQLANDFSEFMKPAQIRFNFLLGNEAAKQNWEEYSEKRVSDLAEQVDLPEIFVLLNLEKNYQLRRFLEELQKVYKTVDIQKLDMLLIKREKQLKGVSRTKLGKENPYYQEVWVGGFGLQYRYPDACRLLTDAAKAEEAQ